MSDAQRLALHDMPIGTTMAFVEAASAHPSSDLATLASFAGYGTSTGKKAVANAITLGLMAENAGHYACRADAVSRGMSEDTGLQVFRRALQAFRPFEVLCEGLALGEPSEEAIRKTRLLLGLDPGEEAKLRILIRWAGDTGLVEDHDGTLAIRSDLVSDTPQDSGLPTQAELDSRMKARLYNSKKLGQPANNFLDEVDRGLLADALSWCQRKPKDSIEAAGQALEDFLRQVAVACNLQREAQKCSGSGQLANLLHTAGVIHSHHQKLVDSVGAIRNAKTHKKDKKNLAPWKITAEAALAAVEMNLVAIRSVYEFVFQRRQIL